MRNSFLALTLLSVLFLLTNGWPQEEKATPSQKTQEAIEKFKKAQEIPGKALEALKEAGRAKLQEVLGTQSPAKSEGDPLALPKPPDKPDAPAYSPTGKRDPFRPLTMRARVSTRPRESLSPLERYELGQLKLVAIVWDLKEPRAMVEDATGLGYIIKIGTPIGPNEGKVKAIKPSEILIEESHVDFFGAKKRQETSMKLPLDDEVRK